MPGFIRPWPLLIPVLCVVIGGGLGCLSGCGQRAAEPPSPSEGPAPTPATTNTNLPEDIENQVHNFCGVACHRYPAPDTFPRKHWRAEVERGFRFFDQSGYALNPPKLADVVRYYEERAPEEYPPANTPPATKPLGIALAPISYPPPPGGPRPMISHVQAIRLPRSGLRAAEVTDQEPLSLLACDMSGGRLLVLRPGDPNPAWRELARVPSPAHAEVLDLDGDGWLDILVADLGSFAPTDRRCGSVVWLRGRKDGSFQTHTLLKNVGRVADVQAADFRGTGKRDLVVGVFGLHTTGEVLFLENRTTDWDAPQFVPHLVDNRHGTIHVPITDLNGDGRPDFVALIGQEHETVVAFLNEGGGRFGKKTLYTAPHPGWGSSGIQLVDMNGDGRIDVLYTNGDILDEPYLWKPYHGVQWLENKGDLRFEHHRIADMYGVHHAVAAPVTGKQWPDVVAVSFLPGDKFPDRVERRADAVVLFEQTAPGRFERHTLATGSCDAVVCAVADLYRTGRLDIVVGNFSSMTTDHPVTIWKNLGKK
jgi:hypothetical protein